MLKGRALVLLATLAASAATTPPVPAATRVANEPGFSGYFGLGLNLAQVKSNLVAATLTLFFSDPLAAKGWIANATLAYAREDNAIDFYDTSLSLISIGMLRRF